MKNYLHNCTRLIAFLTREPRGVIAYQLEEVLYDIVLQAEHSESVAGLGQRYNLVRELKDIVLELESDLIP